MFQSIKWTTVKWVLENKTYICTYQIKDSDFVSDCLVSAAATIALADLSLVVESTVALIQEYEGRKYDHKEIVSNLFLLNMFLLKQGVYKDINAILNIQHKYLIKENFPETNFNEKYYDDLVKYIKKMMVIL